MNVSLTDPFGREFKVGDYVYAAKQSSYGGGKIRQITAIDDLNKMLQLYHPKGATYWDGGPSTRGHKFWKHYSDVVKAPDGWVPPSV